MFVFVSLIGGIGQSEFQRKLMFPSKKLGVALVGLGNYSEKKLATSILRSKYCYLSGIVSGSQEKINWWSKKFNIPQNNCYNYQNFDSIINNPAVDIVYIVLPTFMHAEFTIRAAKAGKHVICEKPMAMSSEEAEKMINACKNANVKLGIGYRLYYEPHHLRLQEIVQRKTFGNIISIESSFGFKIKNKFNWRLDDKLGGGAIMDLGIYPIQNACKLMGELPISVIAQNKNDTIYWEFEFKNGVIVKSFTSFLFYTDRLKVIFENGCCELSPAFDLSNINGIPIDKRLRLFTKNYHAIKQIDDFAYSVLNNSSPKCSGEVGIRDIQLIEKILKAVETETKTFI